MLSYQHAYHAGGPADVVKHTLWAAILTQLVKKESPLHVFETHSGRGLYPTSAPETQKTPEYLTGVARIPMANTTPYMDAVRTLNTVDARLMAQLEVIPGSPAVAKHVLRDVDHLHLAEAHPLELEHLRTNFPHALRRERNIHIHEGDGHKLIPTLIRPGNRNAVLIDPSYEIKTEYQQVVETVRDIITRAPNTTVMVWYPLLNPKKNSQLLIDRLKSLNVSATFLTHYGWNKPDADGMHGTGQIILGLPYKIERDLTETLKSLAPQLKQKAADLTTTMLIPRR